MHMNTRWYKVFRPCCVDRWKIRRHFLFWSSWERKKCFLSLLNVVISLSNRGGFYFCKAVICQCQSNEGKISFCSRLCTQSINHKLFRSRQLLVKGSALKRLIDCLKWKQSFESSQIWHFSEKIMKVCFIF